MKVILNQLFEQQKLSEQQAYDVLTKIGNGAYNSSQVASFLTVFLMRNISVDELKGFQKALLDLCLKIDLCEFNTIDLCGTGGDGKNTFNISTISSFVVAGAGYKVAKHGNYGVSSNCGSSNVLEYLGYKFTNDESKLKKQLDIANFCMMHAPLFHPAMKNVGPIRAELGVKTFFNMLGPIVNPSFPKNQMVGVFNLELARIYNYLLQDSTKNFKVVHSLDGYDEISLTSKFKLISNNGDYLISPKEIGFDQLNQASIYGGETIQEAAKIFIDVLENKGTKAQQNVVIANSAFAIQCFEPTKSYDECKGLAIASLEAGNAIKCLKAVIN
ncbi:anthranilate phosphoribosyltransferase [Vicingus serpentipes]|uniref:Anthranilate phosphoribosyltransferase n=1 Tax=Vicingus serpentipes TaxID=1926625 RepID=A0A5C6RRN0_9FLAO|nr:anthranilate phosphoribosyltransferase [Vicingus serpentipes]TXB64300.1 anthranilate phosphoribosyltransferase [Vicingus serpentipes]